MRVLLLAVGLLALAPAGGASDQPQPVAVDGVVRLLGELEKAIESGNPERYLDLVSPLADPERAVEFAETYIESGVTRAVVRERDRAHLQGSLPGNGYELVVDVFIESGPRGRMATWLLDVRRSGALSEDPAQPAQSAWMITGQQRITSLDGLHRLSVNPRKQFAARDLTVTAEDLQLRLMEGSVFVGETAEGVTALVLLGRGDMRFAPGPASERGQVKIFSGSQMLESRFDAAFIRINPSEFASRLSAGALVERPVDARELKRADEIFREDVGKSFGLDLSDLSRDTWSLLPTAGDFLAEIRTRRFDTLTYARSGSEPEDITLFDRRRRRNIAVYPSQQKLASRGRFYDEDELTDYDVLSYDVEAAFTPDRAWVEGRATLRIRVRAFALGTLTLRLAESLVVHSVAADRLGRLLSLRVRNQNSVVINLPAPVSRDTELGLTLAYSGRLPPQTPEREAVALGQGRGSAQEEPITAIAAERSYLYSNRAYWYPQSPVTDYATATLRLTVPAEYALVASGELAEGSPQLLPGKRARGVAGPRKQYLFVALQPLRYLACVISRFVRVDSTLVSVGPARREGHQATNGGGRRPDPSRAAGVSYDSVQVVVETNPRQQARGRDLSLQAADILRFYGSVIGDCPYPSFTLALVENELPGGHSPAYFAALNQPLPTSPFVWRNDPAAFASYPEFFLAHELAHQWWGQAVGWKNFHEQWLSEGFAQYFAALYAERIRGAEVFAGIIRQFRKWAMEESDQGPVYLGYRLGHVKGDSRIFRALVYNKAAGVLHMLRRLIGDEHFFGGLRRFYGTWRFHKAGTDDLRRAFEAETGRSLERFFERWIHEPSLPKLKFSQRTDGAPGAQALVARFEQVGELYDVPVTVTLQYADRSPADVIVAVTDRVTEARIPLSGTLRSVEVNRDEMALATISRQ